MMSIILKYANYSLTDLEKEFNCNISTGLSNKEALLRQHKFGLNIIKDKKKYFLEIFLRQLKSPFIYLLFFTAILSFFLKDRISAFIVLLIIIINTLVGFIQEYRTKKALELLKKHLAINVKVLRSGQWTILESKELVPGDIIQLRPGDFVPADVRFIKTDRVTIDESILTGESFAVDKISDQINYEVANIYKAKNLGFTSTIVATGLAIAIVLATGKNTVFASIGQLSFKISEESNFKVQITRFSKFILLVIIITVIILFIVYFLFKQNKISIIELLFFVVALTLGLTPESLPTVITFALSRGALILSKQGIIIKRLSALEDLGSITVLCTDKTGTLTQNKLKISNILTNKDDFMVLALLSAEKDEAAQESFDKAIWDKATDKYKVGLSDYKIIEYMPFDPRRKKTLVLLQFGNKYMLISRGAPEEIIKYCDKNSILPNTDNWLSQESKLGNRVLAISYSIFNYKPEDILKSETNFIFAGLISFTDPVKPDAKLAIEKAKKLGINIKILTGDTKEVACSVAKQIGLELNSCEKAITGQEFSKLSQSDKKKIANQNVIFARILPEQKLEIIKLIKKFNNVVGYLGDGINDAPALKGADVGIVVKYSSDLAKEIADIVLSRKSLNSIIDGIANGRIVSSNVIKYIITTLSSNFGNFYSIAIASLFINFLPMLPIQILLLNLLSDFPMIAISTDQVDSSELKKPSTYNLKFIGITSILFGIISSIFDFIFFVNFYKFGPVILRTAWFTGSLLTEQVLIFSLRTKKFFMFAKRPSKLLIILSLLTASLAVILPNTSLGQTLFYFYPINLEKMFIIILIVIGYFICTELTKLIYFSKLNNLKK